MSHSNVTYESYHTYECVMSHTPFFIQVIVDAKTTLKVCDVIEYDSAGKIVSLNAYKT